MKQLIITPVMGKRLIAKAVARHPALQPALRQGTVAIIAGTTNGYVAEEILSMIGQADRFSRERFFRGLTLPPGKTREKDQTAGEKPFPGDVIIVDGLWQPGQTIFEVIDQLNEGDVILKGANALNLRQRQAAVLIGHPQGGTIATAMQAVVGRRTRLLVPVGLEKRVERDLDQLARLLNQPDGEGPRLYPVPGGEIISELEALMLLTGVEAELSAAGGVGGAEGAVWLTIHGTAPAEQATSELIEQLAQANTE